MRHVSWWGVVSSAVPPLLLACGWTVAASLQQAPYDPVRDTVSGLAALDATYRWVMTLAFAVAGACEVVTGLALRPARMPGRVVLMAGGAAGVLVAASPLQAGALPLRHALFAAAGLGALACWPAGAWRAGPTAPWALRPAATACAVAVLLALLAWFGAELIIEAGRAGLAERVLGLAQSGWPCVVVASCRHTASERVLRDQGRLRRRAWLSGVARAVLRTRVTHG